MYIEAVAGGGINGKEGDDLGIRSEPDIENLLRDGVKPDPAHKEALRSRLFHSPEELSLDDLEDVIGGASRGNQREAREFWELRDEDFPLTPFPDN